MLGGSIAIVATGPSPGSTPISVPRTAPPNAYSRFWKVNATPKPSARFCSSSILRPSGDERRPERDRQLQPDDKDEPAADRQDDRVDDRVLPVELVAGERRPDDEQRQRDDHA